ncbi:hypothetical protein BVC80_8969g16 [Macleaya cordata]|uniref:Transposase-associated domain-containing protein n=1 Tax=Macleaya cordata TaxID=56857 RepID=A0A200QJB6_MACCD|nr:hypothetical protein BVC80_8969g16 [Macleaya cordata]
MSSTPPSKEWMDADTLLAEYFQGVASFLKFTKDKLGGDDWYYCPCTKCLNYHKGKKTLKVISEHLICNGIDNSYRTWFNHGEPLCKTTINVRVSSSSSANVHNENAFPKMEDLFNDTFGRIHLDDLDECLIESIQQNDTLARED